MKTAFLPCLLFLCAIHVSARTRDNILQERTPTCAQVVDRATNRRVRVVNPHQLKGKWVSSRCETRPGPQYVTRSYKFQRNGSFKLLLHVYQDQHCTKPALTFNARGKILVGRPSWVTPGGTHAEYLLNKLYVVPHTRSEADAVDEAINLACPNSTFTKPVSPHHPISILEYSELSNEVTRNYDCTHLMEITWNELQLLRQEETRHRLREEDKAVVKKHLFLGDMHTDIDRQKEYRPTAYQAPLVSTDTMHDCEVCEIVSRSTEKAPPYLQVQPELPLLLEGSWASSKCEVQRYGMFLTRKITFNHRNDTWQLQQRYYKDPLCRYVTYSLDASGSYMEAGRAASPSYISYTYESIVATKSTSDEDNNSLPDFSYLTPTQKDKNVRKRFNQLDNSLISDNTVDSSSHLFSDVGFVTSKSSSSPFYDSNYRLQEETHGYDLMIEELSITPGNHLVVNQLNSGRGGKCGHPGTWRLGVKQDVTFTGGCAPIGLRIPSLEREIIKNEMNEDGNLQLYLGQTPTRPHVDDINQVLRPTSWAPPLTRCVRSDRVEEVNELLPMMGARVALNAGWMTLPNMLLLIVPLCHLNF